MSAKLSLMACLFRLAQLQRESVDRLAISQAVDAAPERDPHEQIDQVVRQLELRAPRWMNDPDPALLPMLVFDPAGRWGILRAQNAHGAWVSEWWDMEAQGWREESHDALPDHQLVALRLRPPFSASKSEVYQLIRRELAASKGLLFEAAVGGILINMMALASSFYSMQVYDRVVPTGAMQTLLVLTLGVVVATFFEYLAKSARSRLYERFVDQVDQRLARNIFMRFLAIRLDQMPRSVGGLAAQMRGYESVRTYLVGLTSHMMIDAPFGVLFLAMIAMIGGMLCLVPLGFLVVSLSIGVYMRRRMDHLANKINDAGAFKTGLLVESVEGAETIKSGQAGWRMLSRWMEITDDARENELTMRHMSESSQYMMAAFQQGSYVLLVALGALWVSRGELTMGALIACSILSGRVLTPVAMMPALLVQRAQAMASVANLDRLWALENDHHGQQPLAPEVIHGNFRFESVATSYSGRPALTVSALQIRAGERVGVLGPVGAGKTTLLRLLTGMYKPQTGRVMLDDMDLALVSKPLLSQVMGYVQQDGRLFAGTLRENLILGILDPGDDAIMSASKKTGLYHAVIEAHPLGVDQVIFEGGLGLSGGQKQLVHLTRALLREPRIWLLDEPTASMDRQLEVQVIATLKEAIKPEDTLVIVTHKTEMLELVDRVIVVVNHQIVLDGPKAAVLQRLQSPAAADTIARGA